MVCFTGAVENWRMAANLYTKDHPKDNYFSDLIMIHMSLGLGVKYGKAVALASLVGLKFRQFSGSAIVLKGCKTTKPISGREGEGIVFHDIRITHTLMLHMIFFSL